MNHDDEITLKEIDVSFFRDRIPPNRWSHWLLQQTMHTTDKLPGVKVRLALIFLKLSGWLIKGVTHA